MLGNLLCFVIFDDMICNCPGNASVPVANCSEERSYSHPKADMKFSEFVEYMKQLEKEKTILYLKDWHCQRHVSCWLFIICAMVVGDWFQ